MEEFKNSVSAILRSLRAEHNYTQQEVAEKANIDVMTVGRYENNPNTIVLDILEKILFVYGLDCYIFFDKVNAKKHIKKEEKE